MDHYVGFLQIESHIRIYQLLSASQVSAGIVIVQVCGLYIVFLQHKFVLTWSIAA